MPDDRRLPLRDCCTWCAHPRGHAQPCPNVINTAPRNNQTCGHAHAPGGRHEQTPTAAERSLSSHLVRTSSPTGAHRPGRVFDVAARFLIQFCLNCSVEKTEPTPTKERMA
jgi:hypothetical protein